MAIVSTDIVHRYSMGNTGATGASTMAASLGGTISSTAVPTGINNIWDDVTDSERVAGITTYKCLYVVNTHATLTWQGVKVWIEVGSGDTPEDLDVALDPAAVGADSTTVIANRTTAPSGVTFANTAVSKATGLLIGDMAPGTKKALWFKRVVVAGAAGATITPGHRVEGDTAA